MLVFVALKPDKTPLGVYPTLKEAQEGIAFYEPDVMAQCQFQIHPIRSSQDAEQLKLKVQIHYCLEKYDGEYVGQAPVEVLTGEG